MKIIRNTFFPLLIIIVSMICVSAQGLRDATAGDKGSAKRAGNRESLIGPANYVFSAQSGVALEEMSSGTKQLINPGTDNDNSLLEEIGFLFRYDGAFLTAFGVNGNGLLRLGGVPLGSSTLNSIDSVANSPKIMPFWDDLCVGNTGKVHYKLVPGAPGARKLVIEWKNMKITRGNGCDGSGGGTFQVWLFDRTGVIQFVYGDGMVAATALNGGYSVGIQGGAATNLASVTTATNSVSYTTANNTQIDAIAPGTSYLFSPNIPAPVSGLTATPTQTTVQIDWTDNATDETAYLVTRTTDHIVFYFVGNVLAPNSTTFTDTELEPGTQYFYYVNALTDGAFAENVFVPVTTGTGGTISSTAAGGAWSQPSTWVGGVIPDAIDIVTIVSGATVTIDTATARAGSIFVGSGGAAPATLRFGENAAFKLTVTHNITINPNDVLTTGGGNTDQHLLSLGGDLINNGTLDLSTNNNAAGAALVFTGNSSNTFGGNGPITDIRSMTVNKGPTNANILELSPANFTVQGSAAQNPGSNFLTLNGGTFKISGTFPGSHTTFSTAAYNIGESAGFWLNNPNYTIVGLDDFAFVSGLLRISAGTFNIGGGNGTPVSLFSTSTTIIEGGSLNIAAGIFGGGTYTQTAGTVTACKLPLTSSASTACFSLGGVVTMSGGEVVLQNPSAHNGGGFEDYKVNMGSGVAGMGPITGTTVRFGNASTAAVSTFRAGGLLPNVVIDNSAGAHTVRLSAQQEGTSTRNVNISAGTTLEVARFNMMGTTFVNHGILNAYAPGYMSVDDGTGLSDVSYSGTGTMTGELVLLYIRGNRMTFDPSSGNIRTHNLTVDQADVINAARITFGTGNNQLSTCEMRDGASLDSAPDFNITTGGEKVIYSGTGEFTTGPEIKPDRTLFDLTVNVAGSVNIGDGNLLITNFLRMTNGVIKTGSSVLTLLNAVAPLRTNGYVDGHLRRQIANMAATYVFDVGQNGYSPASITTSTISGNVYLTVTPVDATLPGLLPATSLSRYWTVTEEGDLAGQLRFFWPAGDVRGNAATYKLWHSSGGGPVLVPGSQIQSGLGIESPLGITDFTGNWSAGNDLDPGPVSVSGRVLTPGGAGIRNAIVRISGGNLTQPIVFQTGQFGVYNFTGLQAGETYNVHVSAKRFRFSSGDQAVTPFGNVTEVNFVANPQEEF